MPAIHESNLTLQIFIRNSIICNSSYYNNYVRTLITGIQELWLTPGADKNEMCLVPPALHSLAKAVL